MTSNINTDSGGGLSCVLAGDPRRVDLSTSTFANIINNNNLYVDKSRFIEDFINSSSSVQLIARQRRLGKSLNMYMLRAFLTDCEDNGALFKGLYIEHSQVWGLLRSAPCFMFDFKGLSVKGYKAEVFAQVDTYIEQYVDKTKLSESSKRALDNYIINNTDNTSGLGLLIDLVSETTGKQSYILIDEYDKLLMDNRNSAEYKDIQDYVTALLSAALKGNPHLKSGLYENYWVNSGTLDLIQGLLTPERRADISVMLNGDTAVVPVNNKISLIQLDDDSAFYSLLIQAGYLSLQTYTGAATSKVTVPNKELTAVWQDFILKKEVESRHGDKETI